MSDLKHHRAEMHKLHLTDEDNFVRHLIDTGHGPIDERALTQTRAAKIVSDIRSDGNPGLMEVFLAEYGLSSGEGIALMCLAEALLRVPDAETIDDLIEDKLTDRLWGAHRGESDSSLVNASTWALMLTGKVLDDDGATGVTGAMKSLLKRMGEPVIRRAVRVAMKEMGNQFVLGESIQSAVKRGQKRMDQGYTYSFDMLGEAALTDADAMHFVGAYEAAIAHLAKSSTHSDVRQNPGISIKLSALFPRYELAQREQVMDVLVERTLDLVLQARAANLGLNIDAEEADRLELSLDVIGAVMSDARLKGWDGFGVVVQAYSKRATAAIDWLNALAEKLDRKIMIRLVKGAYWDTEIKRSQVDGLAGFPVFTKKSATDISYIACARQLLALPRIYPQFATHNAHTVQAILDMAGTDENYEFQRLHGMGASLYEVVKKSNDIRCRIYAPVGVHDDLLAYLVRRLLENGANSSFVNQVIDDAVAPEVVVRDPVETWLETEGQPAKGVVLPCNLFQPERPNSLGFDLASATEIARIDAARAPFAATTWDVAAKLTDGVAHGEVVSVFNPANPVDQVGTVQRANAKDAARAIKAARKWNVSQAERAAILNRAADLYEENFGEVFAILAREAGKTVKDAVAELREAVDFLRYYAAQSAQLTAPARGLVTCISPWNFPLAIFTGQLSAALAAGNGVLAKPAESTSIMAARAVDWLHEAGVPKDVLQLVIGTGAEVGAHLAASPKMGAVVFTGSTATAQRINRAMAETGNPSAPLIAETGGLNAMIVDSSALPEQAVRDIVDSAFQSAGQRCSALRMLYVQEDVAPKFLEMLYGAMQTQIAADPWDMTTDIGPVIDDNAAMGIQNHIDEATAEGRVLRQGSVPKSGHFIRPTVIKLDGIHQMQNEIFGPVLHVATFAASELPDLIATINDTGYGLTFGVHSRIDARIEMLTEGLRVGNIYVNRNQIGAVVGSQPFGGEGMSGTGPKAGGPEYLGLFVAGEKGDATPYPKATMTAVVAQDAINQAEPFDDVALSKQFLPGPTGELNRLSTHGRGVVLCLGPTEKQAEAQAEIAKENGCVAVKFAGSLPLESLTNLSGFDAVALWSDDAALSVARLALAKREGALIPLLTNPSMGNRCLLERHVCIDTTAAGGNAALLAAG